VDLTPGAKVGEVGGAELKGNDDSKRGLRNRTFVGKKGKRLLLLETKDARGREKRVTGGGTVSGFR